MTYGKLMVDRQAQGAHENGTLILKDLGIVSFLKKAKDLVLGIVSRIRDTVSNVFSKGGDSSDAQETVTHMLEYLPVMAAATAIHTEVEDAVMDVFDDEEVEQVECVCEPDACQLCLDNQDAGPIKRGEEFPSGHKSSPFHFSCRCNVVPA
jgi:hypothetical protein